MRVIIILSDESGVEGGRFCQAVSINAEWLTGVGATAAR